MVWAADYPHINAPFPGAVKQTLEILSDVPEASVRRILRENALRLYPLES